MRRAFVVAVLLANATTLAAQSSQFGVRGIGYPGRPLSVRALGTAGAFGMFDAASSLNPAALVGFEQLQAGFTGVQDYRSVDNPAGSASLRETRFPQFAVGGTLPRRPVTLGLSYSNYMSRDFSVVAADTLELRGDSVAVSDTLTSRGGIGEIRAGVAYHPGRWSVGAALHVLTGSNRLRARRVFADSAYLTAGQATELSYAGVGLSAGVMGTVGPRLTVAATVRADGRLDVDRDTARVSSVDLPYTLGLGVRWRASRRLQVAAAGVGSTWSAANSDLVGQGGGGARNTVELALGVEYSPNLARPSQRPLRLGVRYATLPFPLGPAAAQPHEFGVALGTGTRFAAGRAGFDLSLQRVWRSADAYKERAWLVGVGVLVTP